MKYTKITAFLIICTMVLCSCKNSDKTSSEEYTELTVREQGEPYSDWGMSTTGSAKYLDGSTVLVSIFLDDKNALWTESDKELVMHNMDVACDFLADEGERYGKDVTLIYDISQYEDLEYHVNYNKVFPGSSNIDDGDEKITEFVYYMYDYIEDNIPSKEIMEKYQVNSIGYLVFIDGETNSATAYSHYCDLENTYYEEIAFINLRWKSGKNVNPDTYAHEILHLFGARDLYCTKKTNGITKDFVIYADEHYPEDIMLGSAASVVSKKDSVTSEISKLTAYFIGWKDYISEVEKFPSIKVKYVASFGYSENSSGNYADFTLTLDQMDETQYRNYIISKVLSVLLIISIIVIFIRHIILFKKQKEIEATIYLQENSPENY